MWTKLSAYLIYRNNLTRVIDTALINENLKIKMRYINKLTSETLKMLLKIY